MEPPVAEPSYPEAPGREPLAADHGDALPRVAYVMSRFPKLTETFILDELVAMDRAGLPVELFPLLRERTTVMHESARPWVARAHFLPFLSPAILWSNLVVLVHQPRTYLGTLVAMVRGTAGSVNFLLGSIGVFPKVVHAGRRMQALGVRHVHCHFANHPALAGWLIHRLTGIPYSFTAHGSDLHVDKTMLATKVADAAFTVTVSESNARVIERAVGGTVPNLHVIHCGIDRTVFHPVERASGRPPVITCVGSLIEVKGQTHLLDALALLHDRGIDARLRFVGNGPDQARLEEQASRLGLTDRVAFLGARTRDEVVTLLSETDLLVTPSVPTSGGKREGLPVVLIEAMAAGVPVVASELSGIPELVEDGVTGLTTPPGDPRAIAASIERLLTDPRLAGRLAAAGLARVASGWDLDTNARRLIALFAASAAA
jgi:colanic acid/amylovoran biosynthesis glycosyltransferase